jgi:hypothetical protein
MQDERPVRDRGSLRYQRRDALRNAAQERVEQPRLVADVLGRQDDLRARIRILRDVEDRKEVVVRIAGCPVFGKERAEVPQQPGELRFLREVRPVPRETAQIRFSRRLRKVRREPIAA